MKLRPFLKYELDNMHSREVRKLVLESVQAVNPAFMTEQTEAYIHVFYPKNLQKMWTPRLAVTFEDTETGVIVRGKIGPSANIWLAYVFFYFFLTVAILFVLFYGISQLTINQHPDSLYLLVPLLLALAGMYLVSYLGQRKSSHCILDLRRVLEEPFAKHPSRVL